jgi:two-component system response regulator HydG
MADTPVLPPVPDGASAPVTVLVVEDQPGLRKSLVRILRSRGHEVESGEAALAAMATLEPDVALVDLMMPGMDGFEVLRRLKELRPNLAVIMMTAMTDLGLAVRAVEAGAYHFLTKPFASNDAVAVAVAKAAEHRRLEARAELLQRRLEAQERVGELIGTSPAMEAIYRVIEGISSSTSTVLVLGESGTGKELVARAIHRRSPRASRPMVTVNCGAIPKDLVESELFGHVRGAFTGASAARAGLFDAADKGTIFLDEVGELPLPAQVKLLRTLQEGEIRRVGSDETERVDVRVIAATNADIAESVASGSFRRDLYYRLNVIPLVLPALRERGDDVLLLAYHFVRKLSRRMERAPKPLAPGAVAALMAYAWPGNVRELEHALEHAFVLSRGAQIEASDLPAPVRAAAVEPAKTPSERHQVAVTLENELFDLPYADAKQRALAAFDEAYLAAVLAKCDGNTSDAARRAGLDRSNFRRVFRRARGE